MGSFAAASLNTRPRIEGVCICVVHAILKECSSNTETIYFKDSRIRDWRLFVHNVLQSCIVHCLFMHCGVLLQGAEIWVPSTEDGILKLRIKHCLTGLSL